MTNKKKGFTLIELMIVVVIIGILAAIAIPNFLKFQAKGKQAEANSNLKTIFSVQKASFPALQGYWSDVGGIGFAPERGNRYRYDLGPTAPTVLMGAEGAWALGGACVNLVDRSVALQVAMDGDCGYDYDIAKFDNMLLTGLTIGTGAVTYMAEVPGNMDLTASNVGVNGAQCPNCDFAASAVTNVDNDMGADLWFISSQSADTAGVVGCGPARTIANMNGFTSGTPILAVDDVCFDG